VVPRDLASWCRPLCDNLQGWRSVCEQNDMQVGDEVHFTVLDAHMEFRVSHGGALPPPKATLTPPSTPRTQGPPYIPTSASSLEDKLHLDQVRFPPPPSSFKSFQDHPRQRSA